MTKEELNDIANQIVSDFGFGENRMCGADYGDIIEEKIIPLLQSFEHYATDFHPDSSPVKQVCMIYWLMMKAYAKGEKSGREGVAERLKDLCMGYEL